MSNDEGKLNLLIANYVAIYGFIAVRTNTKTIINPVKSIFAIDDNGNVIDIDEVKNETQAHSDN